MIGTFFELLANDRGRTAAGIILSGSGTDRTRGARAIRDKMGIVLIQDPDTVQHRGMPDSAIGTGLVDRVLRVDDMTEIPPKGRFIKCGCRLAGCGEPWTGSSFGRKPIEPAGINAGGEHV